MLSGLVGQHTRTNVSSSLKVVRQRARKLSSAFAAVLTCFVLVPAVFPQTLSAFMPGAQQPATSAAHVDPLRRNTPRSAIYAFLQACHAGRFDLASQYLDLRRTRADQRDVLGPQLAKNLSEILDRDRQFEVGRLSNDPAGDPADGLPSNLDKLQSFEVNAKAVTLTMEKVTQGDTDVWLVSPESVARIPQLLGSLEESAFEKRLPEALVKTKLVGTPLWVWLALILSAILLALISRFLSNLLLLVIKPLAQRYANTLHANRVESFADPLRLLLAVLVFGACVGAIGPSALLRDYIYRLLSFLFVLSCTSIAMRVVDVISDTVTSRLNPRERALSYSVLPLFIRTIKIALFGIAVLFVLSAWGYNTNAILAGFGVGGIAVALASQKTIENLFGGISVISDRPVLVGDFCQFGGQTGTVEDIGLRSTRIRTLDRTLVTVPNSSFSTMTLENFSKRDRMWFHPTLHLRRDTEPEKIRAMMDAVQAVLQKQPKVDPTDVPLRFTRISKDSFDLEIFAYVLTPDYNEYLRTQSELLLKILDAAKALDIAFAIPISQPLGGPPPPTKEQAAPALNRSNST